MIEPRDLHKTLAGVLAVEPVTPPNAGARWHPIRHGDFITALRKEMEYLGWTSDSEVYALSKTETDLAGAFTLRGVEDAPVPHGTRLSIGFVNSNSRRKSLHLVAGLWVDATGVGVPMFRVDINKYHDKTVDLAEDLSEGLKKWHRAAKLVSAAYNDYSKQPISPEAASHAFMQAGRMRWIGWAAVGRCDKEYRCPTRPRASVNTAVDVMEAFAYVARHHIHPLYQMEYLMKFNDFVMGK